MRLIYSFRGQALGFDSRGEGEKLIDEVRQIAYGVHVYFGNGFIG